MNPVALITGASRGIGRGIALELAGLGWDLVLNYRSNRSAAESTAAACSEAARQHQVRVGVELCQADIALSRDRHRLIEFTRQAFHRLDLLVNNAGIAPVTRADLLEATEESFDDVLATNLKGPYFLTQLAARWMVEQQTVKAHPPGARPKIITISSISAYTASTNRGEYCISKAGLSMMTALYAARLAAHGINVYEIRPGVIATDMTSAVKSKYDQLIENGLTPIQRWGEPADIAKAVAALAQDLFPFSTGEVINVDGGFHLRRL
jgi:NAD(P)-dependent dehydrogenase (short-subunit alcohol dehydrogenase family)